MKRLLVLLFTTIIATNISAQTADTISFIQSKRMAEADLAKKRDGTFVTGIPDFSSDPVTGFGLGVRTNVYWNGQRTNPFFAYTPYLAKLKANAAYYTSNAREIILSLDVPYYKGTRWRIKIDFKAQQNPANLYFVQQNQHLENCDCHQLQTVNKLIQLTHLLTKHEKPYDQVELAKKVL